MLIKLRKNRAQNTAEYAIVIGLVVAAIIGMQPFIKRAWQGKAKQFTDEYVKCGEEGTTFGTDADYQYEYGATYADISTNQSASSTEKISGRAINKDLIREETTRTGYQEFKYGE